MPATTLEPGCYLDGHRGHYLTRDMIELAIGFGYIVGSFEQFALDAYEEHHSDDFPAFPHEALVELSDDALAWLNGGPNEGVDRPIKGQNSPPIVPAGYSWEWFDGEFGLYADEPQD